MQTARRLIVALSCTIVLWVFTSVAGALLDPTHAAFWSSSLMWSLLSTLLVAPALVMVFDTSLVRRTETPRRAAAAQEPTPAAEGRSAPRRETSWPTSDRRHPSASQRSFVENAAGAAYPIPEELGEQQTDPENSRPDWAGTYAV
ncbi:MAG: hypothetical protein V5A22_04555 [Salinivenus sp.]